MISNFLIIHCIGNDDKLGLRINKDFFIHHFKNSQNKNDQLVSEIFYLLDINKVSLDENFSVIINLGPGSFSGIRIALAVAKGLEIAKKVRLFGYKNKDLKVFDQENIIKLFDKKLVEKKLIKAIYLS